jgi:hypothetical protein
MLSRIQAVMFAAGLGAFTALAAPAQASLIGESFHADRLFPDAASVLADLGDAVVGAGVEFTASFLVDITDTQIIINSFVGGGIIADTAFNGLRLTDLGAAGITSLSVAASNLDGFGADNLTLSGADIFINFTNDGFSPNFDENTEIVINVHQGELAVPAPGSLALLLAGSAGLLLGRRRGANFA